MLSVASASNVVAAKEKLDRNHEQETSVLRGISKSSRSQDGRKANNTVSRDDFDDLVSTKMRARWPLFQGRVHDDF